MDFQHLILVFSLRSCLLVRSNVQYQQQLTLGPATTIAPLKITEAGETESKRIEKNIAPYYYSPL